MHPKRKILFLCHGNICRSPMAEYVMKALCEEAGVADQFDISSAAVSTEETGNDIYPPAKRQLRAKGIPFGSHAAHQITQAEYDSYDYIVCADRSNVRWLKHIVRVRNEEGETPSIQCKVSLLMQWAGEERDVADPWYTGDFERAYDDILIGCKAMMKECTKGW